MHGPKHTGVVALALAAGAAMALAGVFVLYTRPDFLLQLSNQIWACF